MFRITKDPSSGSFIQCLAKITVMVLADPAAADRTINVILAKYYIKLPNDESFVIRNMLEHF